MVSATGSAVSGANAALSVRALFQTLGKSRLGFASSIVFEPEGAREYVGGYDYWLRQRAEQAAIASPTKKEITSASRATVAAN